MLVSKRKWKFLLTFRHIYLWFKKWIKPPSCPNFHKNLSNQDKTPIQHATFLKRWRKVWETLQKSPKKIEEAFQKCFTIWMAKALAVGSRSLFMTWVLIWPIQGCKTFLKRFSNLFLAYICNVSPKFLQRRRKVSETFFETFLHHFRNVVYCMGFLNFWVYTVFCLVDLSENSFKMRSFLNSEQNHVIL